MISSLPGLAAYTNSRSAEAEIDRRILFHPNSASRRSKNRRSGSCSVRLRAFS
jgi:hypothetical protein